MRQGLLATQAALILASALAAWPVMAQESAPVAPAVTAADWRVVPADNLLVIDTSKGRILVEMAPEVAPGHVARIRMLAKAGFYDGVPWHRVIDGFMAQTGDPLGTGEGQSWHPDLKSEFTFRRDAQTPFTAVAAPAGAQVGFLHSLPVQTQPDAVMATTADRKVHAWGLYCPGVAGMARDDAPDSANSQFFLMRHPYPALEKRYTVWGSVVSGLDVVRALKFSPNPDGIVSEPDRMTRVRVAGDLPVAERPTVRVLNTTSAAFRTLADGVRAARGADFSACDIALPVEVDAPGA
ncbi:MULTISPECIES: peptidylprolyl isomerase [Brevundimonas]|uniref:peptidylprolyl isomerase n=1 Tax=Brevundimonas sp. 357 TaxID=2555782 RepID=UPI000F79917D|nr:MULTISPECIES: peptidylprolyl isomerase [Brevundimonas]RSB47563.1 peptidylprolyl isomerase [Brevundimonas sp. 357]